MGKTGFGLVVKILILIAILSNGVVGLVSGRKLAEVNKRLKLINRPAVKSIQSEDGDVIDCVDIYKQLAFEHPALQNHRVQMEPSSSQTADTTTHHKQRPASIVSQIWKKNGSCPKGTIPVRRIKQKDILRVDSVGKYGQKESNLIRIPTSNHSDQTDHLNRTRSLNLVLANHSMAVGLTVGYSYSGAKADINIWQPTLESDDEFSSAEIWLMNGPYYNQENIESGWIVNPSVYGDRSTRLFTYWTADSSKKTGCFDLICPGFVQTSSEIALGSTIGPISSQLGEQYQITLYIYKDFNTNNWWLQFEDKINIGYWPAELFSSLAHQATFVQWGGQVYSSKIGGITPHTSANMGSGQGDAIYGIGCFMRNLRIRDNSLIDKFPEWITTYADEVYCYSAEMKWGYMFEPELYFGGHGQSYWCP